MSNKQELSIVAAILTLLVLLVSCGQQEEYWVLKYTPVKIKAVIYVEYHPCNIYGARACWNPVTQVVEIKKYLKPDDEACAKRHEASHAAGWAHPENRALVWDCGPTDKQLTAAGSVLEQI